MGEAPVRGAAQESSATAALHRSLLGVDRRYTSLSCFTIQFEGAPTPLAHRYLNADHEMRRIFGSRVVREELG